MSAAIDLQNEITEHERCENDCLEILQKLPTPVIQRELKRLIDKYEPTEQMCSSCRKKCVCTFLQPEKIFKVQSGWLVCSDCVVE